MPRAYRLKVCFSFRMLCATRSISRIEDGAILPLKSIVPQRQNNAGIWYDITYKYFFLFPERSGKTR
jgi:hypothetical protein